MPSRPEHVLRSGDVEIALDLDAGARAVRWTVRGLSLLADHGPGAVEHGMYPMAPWAGRLRGNRVAFGAQEHELAATVGGWALHGTALDQSVVVLRDESDDEYALLAARVVENRGWPWPVAVDVTWKLRGRTLVTEIAVVAEAEECPAVVGWHPWFVRDLGSGGALQWHVEALSQAERGPDHLPTGRLVPYDADAGPFDDAFLAPTGTAGVRWPGALAIDIVNDAPWFVVFDELGDAACVEPQSGPPNGVNDGLGQPIAVAGPGRPHRMITTWTMRDDPPEGRG